MKGSILRQSLQRSDGGRKSPVDIKVGTSTNTEYFGDGPYNRSNKFNQTSIHGDGASFTSPSGSGVGSGEESDDPAPDFEETSGSASTTPPLSQYPSQGDSPEAASSRAWYEFDLSVVLALVSPIGNWLTGGDHVKNILLILLLIFYLHQIVEIPWSLYLMSRPRRASHTTSPKDASATDPYHRAASSELHSLELFYLTLSVLSPFLGTILLRTVLVSVSGPSAISWFSTSLFVLATGMRPWEHAIERLRQRTTDLQNVIYYPPSETQKTQARLEALVEQVAQLEAQLKSLKEQFKVLNTEIYEHVGDATEVMERVARKQEKKIETTRSSFETRLMKVEQGVDLLLETREIRADGATFYASVAGVSMFLSALTNQLSPLLPTWAPLHSRNKCPPSPRSSPKIGRPRAACKLETIPEISTFQPKSSRNLFSSLRIPGLGVALRIGDLATLPVRCVISYLLSGRIYTPRKPISPT
ncbi:hypothetical protein PAXRUDRAFT_417386 [Paxillus rubicundulus Ve08.2h10]|uniref:Uncharacterized protein n=1 Tax=Paxillus rubicundulus Ve08.2h10 TaxID=930991 RepID=A0A0D0E2R4_9AGAM|nr:hypothetical protein PAXRUDRAFT_417386 [Paxillus rubicundulus Ve08.2h10]